MNPIRRVESTVCIYGLRDPRTGSIVYIGKTFDPVKRAAEHVAPSNLALAPHTPRAIWIQALLKQDLKPEFIELEWVPEREWGEAERRWIAHFRSVGQSLLNGTEGGPGGYAESRWAKQRAKGPVLRRTKSGLLGVTEQSRDGRAYWIGYVTQHGKTWRQFFPHTDDGKIQAAQWYEESKQRLTSGLEPVTTKNPKIASTGLRGLLSVTDKRDGRTRWCAQFFADGRPRKKTFPYTDDGKAEALAYLEDQGKNPRWEPKATGSIRHVIQEYYVATCQRKACPVRKSFSCTPEGLEAARQFLADHDAAGVPTQ